MNDPLDRLSGVCVTDRNGVVRELTFRELHHEAAKGMRVMDQAGPRARIEIQRAMDPDYRPIAPYAGLRRVRGRGLA